ncbi:MAG: histidine ammonia-lyase [Candidatus Fermentithermobacillus carboniphilus]|uniref:Histidine ammonia-lyase n=1 Tax=Candidatus Fermentithermobacillus carboniphilus TaxID=3085328 RepID=A0AAT9LAX1_9FIRM|nr:MAG: histidine ammonia-lyase [Candidatus Fermentithermobacillus carboniphilus]
MPVCIDGRPKSLSEIAKVAFFQDCVVIPDETRKKVEDSRKMVESVISAGKTVYGINTGFGKFADFRISSTDLARLQENLLRSHAAGVGPSFSREEVRAAMFLRANALAKGMSGVRPEVIEALKDMLNEDITPIVPEKGSVGASGDLAPLAHIALVLTGEGYAHYRGRILSGKEALCQAGISPLVLHAKEGLALTNGVQMTAGVLALATIKGYILARAADIISSLTGQALRVIADAYDDAIVSGRPQVGAREVAKNLRTLLDGSRLTSAPGEMRVQDPYVLRCIPQVHGAVRQALEHTRSVVEIESGSATDNPLILDDGRVVSGGNFHGQPLAVAGDYLGLALCSLANISERRTARLLDASKSGLPPFLVPEGGLNSGLMLLQYTAAALCSECKVLSHPASVDTIPTSADQEDHVSMSTIAARKARDIAENVANVLAIEFISACQALEFQDRTLLSPAGQAAYRLLRDRVPPLNVDRELSQDVTEARNLIVSGELEKVVENITGSIL